MVWYWVEQTQQPMRQSYHALKSIHLTSWLKLLIYLGEQLKTLEKYNLGVIFYDLSDIIVKSSEINLNLSSCESWNNKALLPTPESAVNKIDLPFISTAEEWI